MAKKLRYALVVALATILGGTLAAPLPARAQEAPITLDVDATHCGAVLTWTNDTDLTFWGDYKVQGDKGVKDAQLPSLPQDPADYGDAHNHGVAPNTIIKSGPLVGQTFGKQFNPVRLPPGETIEVVVSVHEPLTLWAGVRRGPEQDYYVGWTKVRDAQPCSAPSVEFLNICTGVKLSLANGTDAAVPAEFALSPVLDGIGLTVVLQPGLAPEPLLYPISGPITVMELVTGQSWTHEWEQPEGCEGTPTPSPAPPTQPESPAPGPTDSAAGTAGGLPDTGASVGVAAVGALLLLGLGAALFVAGRRRRVRFTA